MAFVGGVLILLTAAVGVLSYLVIGLYERLERLENTPAEGGSLIEPKGMGEEVKYKV